MGVRRGHLHRLGGIKAVTWTDVQQMLIIFCGLSSRWSWRSGCCRASVSFCDAVYLAGAAGRLNAVDLNLRLERPLQRLERTDRRDVPGAGLFRHATSRQVQRYLTGKSIAQSRLSLMFNAMAKIPMQFFILFIGAMVFVFFIFERPPVLFQPVGAEPDSRRRADIRPSNDRYDRGLRSAARSAAAC